MAIRLAPVRSSSAAGTVPGMRVEDFMHFETDFLEEGVVQGVGSELAVVQNSGGANMTVQVGTGRALIEFTTTLLSPNNTTKAWLYNDATITLTVPPADGTHPRIDRVIAKRDTSVDPNGAASNIGVIELLEGTPASSPSAPAEPSNAITLALVSVPASDTAITNSQITDSRPFITLSDGILRNVLRQGLIGNTAEASGTNTVTATFDPALTALTDNTTVVIIPANNNTGAATFAPNGLTAKAIRKLGNTALSANDLKQNFPAILTYNSTDDNWKLQNPANSQSSVTPLVLQPNTGLPSSTFGCAANATVAQQGAIAFGAVTYNGGGSASSFTFSHTTSGSNRLLLVGFYLFSGGGAPAAGVVSSVTYGGVAMTLIDSVAQSNERGFLFGLIAPALGANDVVVTLTGTYSAELGAISYTSANQDYLPDAKSTGTQASGTSVSTATTTLNDNCWVSMFCRNNQGNFTASAGTLRGSTSSKVFIDNNAAKTPAGSVTLTGTWSGTGQAVAVACSIAPSQTGPDLRVFDFDQTKQEHAEWVSVLPSGYSGGTITAKFHWVSSSGSGDVVWGIQARAFADQDDSASAYGTAQTVTDTKVSSKVHITSPTPALTIAGTPTAGQLVHFRVFRDADNASDTLSADARLVAVEISY